MTTPLEREVVRVLEDRAASIRTAPDYQLSPAPGPGRTSKRRRHWPQSRSGLAVIASAAAVTAVVVGLVVAVRADTGRGSGPVHQPGVARCNPTGSGRFAAAMRNGALPPQVQVLSVIADGTALLAVQSHGTTKALQLDRPNGQVSQIWTAARGEQVRAVANPAGAVTSAWVVVALLPIDATPASKMIVVDPSTGRVKQLVADPGYSVNASPQLAPILGDDAVYLIETSLRNPTDQRLIQYWADNDLSTPDFRIRTTGVTSLLPVGGNVVTLTPAGNGSVEVNFNEPQYRPSTLEPVARHGFAFTSDGTTLSWLARRGTAYYLWHWAPGDPSPVGHRVPPSVQPVRALGRFAVSATTAPHAAQRVYDSISARVVELPPGISLVSAAGPTAILLDRSGAGSRSYRIPASVLAAC